VEWSPWRMRQPAGAVCATWGNHDFYGEHQGEAEVEFPGPTRIAIDSLLEIGGLTIWFSPWSNEFMRWAFMKPAAELEGFYAQIPAGVDVLVSHQPPYGYGDQMPADAAKQIVAEHVGSQQLLTAIDRVKPRVVVCGHIHSGYGFYTHGATRIYHVSIVDDDYRLVRGATEIVLD
jgi:hypothetical protein